MRAASPTIELVIFSTKPGVDERAFLAAVEQTNEVLQRFPGYLHREVAYTSDTGQWVDIVHWADRESAMAAAAAFGDLPEVRSFVGAIDFERVTMFHLESRVTNGLYAEAS